MSQHCSALRQILQNLCDIFPQGRMLFVLDQSKFSGYFWVELLAGLRDVSNRVLWRNPSDTFGEGKVPETVAGRFWI